MKSFSKGLLLLGLGAGMALTSCSNESPWGAETSADGKIALNLLTDDSVLTGTRATDNESPLVPGAQEFSISLASTDGTYKNSWNSLESFNNEAGFPMGTYIISAYYGNLDQEGFTNPYFYGESPVSVSLGKESSATITASLGNAMVSIRYSDQFGDYFTGYSATTQTEGHNPVVFAQNESRPAYVKPGTVNLGLTLTNSASQTITVSPSSFEAQPQHHYIVTFGVEGNIDNDRALLTVSWSEEVIEETKEIFLTDEMFTSPAPEIKANGFTSEEQISVFEGIGDDEKNPEFHVFAFGGMEKATLTIVASNNGMVPPCGASVELFNADDATQANLKASGIECVGFWGAVSEMAVINFKDLLKILEPGTYTISLDIEDSLGRHPSEENNVVLNIKVEGIEYQFTGYKKPDFLDNEIEVIVSTNCETLKDELSFYSLDQNSEFQNVSFTYLNDTTQPTVSTNLPFHYAYKLTLPESIIDSNWKVRTQLANKTMREMDIEVNMPEFTIETDAFAKKVKFRISVPDDSKWDVQSIIENAKIYNGNTQIVGGINYISDNIIELAMVDGSNRFNSSTTYNEFSISLGKSLIDSYKNNVKSFTTEEDKDVPNGNFTSLGKPVIIDLINVGGQFNVNVWPFDGDYQNTSSINRNTPADWATINDFTCYLNSSPINSWFTVPSTYVENGVCTILSVGYNHNGTVPSKSGGYMNRNYYCENSPTQDQLNKRAGELFLGTYSYDGSEHRVDGIDFNSRPSYLSFNYTYSNRNDEKAGIIIKVLDSDNNVISQKEENLEQRLNLASINVNLPDYEFGKKAKKLVICFKSTNLVTPDIYIPTGTELNEGITNIRESNGQPKKLNANSYHAVATGSELKVSNVHLGY